MVCEFMEQNLSHPLFQGIFGEMTEEFHERSVVDLDVPAHGGAPVVGTEDIQIVGPCMRTDPGIGQDKDAPVEIFVELVGELL